MSSPAAKGVPNIRSQAAEPELLTTLFGAGAGTYGIRSRNFVISFIIHSIIVVLIATSTTWLYSHRQEIKAQITQTVVELSPYVLPSSKDQAGGGGGGGERSKLDAPKGALPKTSMEQFTPPMVVRRNDNPLLPVEPTVVVPPQIKLAEGAQLGDPLSNVLGTLSSGTGSGGGIGTGTGTGVGSGRGPGVGPGWGGGIGGGPFRVGGGVSAPRPLYQPDPEYSEEARKAKYQGTVVLWVVVGPDGRVHNIRVQRTLGLGLDEKAVEAVRLWKFDPARKDGQPVAVQITVEVNFRLY